MKRLSLRCVTALLAACVMTLSPGCRAATPDREHLPVVLIGLDGLEWNVVLEMLDANRLPTIARLMDGGIYGELSVTKPTLSPIIWTSIATGVTADTHGIAGFLNPNRRRGSATERRKKSEGERLYTSGDRKVKAFWNILSDYDRRVNTVGWWLTYPAEEVNGVMVAQVNTLTPELRRAGRGIWKGTLTRDLAGQVYPPEMQQTVLRALPVVEERLTSMVESIFGDTGKLDTDYESLREQSIWAFRADAIYHRVALDLLAHDPDFDLFAVYFGGSDVVGHRFWRFMYPDLYVTETLASHKQKLGEIVREYYAYLDGLIGDIVAAAPTNATFMIVSDHGMLPVRTDTEDLGADLSGGHLDGPPAFFLAKGPLLRATPIPRQRGPLRRFDIVEHGSILDVTPTILAMLGVPVGRDMVGRVMRDILDPALVEKYGIDYVPTHTDKSWKRTRPSDAVARKDVGERVDQLRALGYLD